MQWTDTSFTSYPFPFIVVYPDSVLSHIALTVVVSSEITLELLMYLSIGELGVVEL